MDIQPIAYISTEFSEKFGIPRQSGLAGGLRARIVFEKQFRDPEALRGVEGFSHLWLIWEFSANRGGRDWQPTVRPPRLGGNQHMGVFATRSPFRPNPLGLSEEEIVIVNSDPHIQAAASKCRNCEAGTYEVHRSVLEELIRDAQGDKVYERETREEREERDYR